MQDCIHGVFNHELEAGIDAIMNAPADFGSLSLIVRRPKVDQREVLEVGELNLTDGLVGDNWRQRGGRGAGQPDPFNQIDVMSARTAALAGDRARWPLAGDQLYVDFDISQDNLPAGSRLRIGEAVIEVSVKPHAGCQKFSSRYGVDALRFVNSEAGRKLRLRGFNASVVVPGTLRQGDPVRKEP